MPGTLPKLNGSAEAKASGWWLPPCKADPRSIPGTSDMAHGDAASYHTGLGSQLMMPRCPGCGCAFPARSSKPCCKRRGRRPRTVPGGRQRSPQAMDDFHLAVKMLCTCPTPCLALGLGRKCWRRTTSSCTALSWEQLQARCWRRPAPVAVAGGSCAHGSWDHGSECSPHVLVCRDHHGDPQPGWTWGGHEEHDRWQWVGWDLSLSGI